MSWIPERYRWPVRAPRWRPTRASSRATSASGTGWTETHGSHPRGGAPGLLHAPFPSAFIAPGISSTIAIAMRRRPLVGSRHFAHPRWRLWHGPWRLAHHRRRRPFVRHWFAARFSWHGRRLRHLAHRTGCGRRLQRPACLTHHGQCRALLWRGLPEHLAPRLLGHGARWRHFAPWRWSRARRIGCWRQGGHHWRLAGALFHPGRFRNRRRARHGPAGLAFLRKWKATTVLRAAAVFRGDTRSILAGKARRRFRQG